LGAKGRTGEKHSFRIRRGEGQGPPRARPGGPPLLLLLDEPSKGLDVKARERVSDILERVAARGTSLLFVTHYKKDLVSSINGRS
jgi:ABC-type ATPase involved in cell division